jgi:phosphoglycerate dehydrogenase-like enzyme
MSNALRVAVLDDFQNVALRLGEWQRLEPRVATTVFTDNVTDEALPKALIDRLPRLKLLVTAGMRNLGIDLEACKARGILVCGTEMGGSPTGELAFGMVLALARNMNQEEWSLRAGQWQTHRIGFCVKGTTLGIAGLGKLGTVMAGYARAFGMNVIAWSQNLTAEKAAAGGATLVSKAELFEQSDFLSLHLILSARTQGIAGAEDIARMKRSAFLINTSRAGLVDEAALIAALKEGRIAGAAIDVFNEEPLPPSAAILSAPNTLLTPHLGYATRESYEHYFPHCIEDIEAWLAGKPVRVLSA